MGGCESALSNKVPLTQPFEACHLNCAMVCFIYLSIAMIDSLYHNYSNSINSMMVAVIFEAKSPKISHTIHKPETRKFYGCSFASSNCLNQVKMVKLLMELWRVMQFFFLVEKDCICQSIVTRVCVGGA